MCDAPMPQLKVVAYNTYGAQRRIMAAKAMGFEK